MSVVTYGELLDGILRSRDPVGDRRRWDSFVSMFEVVDFTTPIAYVWANIRGDLRSRGLALRDNDVIIASTAIFLGMDLVTRNLRHFSRIATLSIIDVS